MTLVGRTAVVTGVGRGLGRCIALRLATLGTKVALVARKPEQLRETADAIVRSGGHAAVLPIDLSQSPSPETIRSSVEAELGPASVLVNAAGVFGPIGRIRDTDPAAWIETLMVNVVGPYLTCRAFAAGMVEAGWGRIVNVSSAAALFPPGPIDSAYATSKAALNHFTRHLASELAGTGVTANVIHPGDVKTDMWADIRSSANRLGSEGAVYRDWAAWVDATGGDDPEKAADLIARIVAEPSDGINGQFLWIERGLRPPVPSW